ncbi:uncharacterized protein N7515_001283 [Penicillium bovifimosum]|uniref:Uncharacterized protein n=1 Tax=Penicillium bovifimosum TaxID=126998 RepID=A0A9W9H9D1_9EURO|nr:uncharacterized protein N7515_001283 [Penicillium bovifimosum]KAJ5142496.1 hypothetical protein N7515_001283 [Penicillium bovifimosum]
MEKHHKKLYSDVVIIGAGLSGIDMACQLQRQLCVSDYVVYDRAGELGGAWAANKCAFSASPSKCLFPSQKEILSYIQRVARTNQVTEHVRFHTEWKGAQWVEASGTVSALGWLELAADAILVISTELPSRNTVEGSYLNGGKSTVVFDALGAPVAKAGVQLLMTL